MKNSRFEATVRVLLVMGAVCFAVLICLFVSELYLRLSRPGNEQRYTVTTKERAIFESAIGRAFYNHSYLPFGMTPGRYTLTSGAQITINSLGYRGPEFTVAKSESNYRILVLGDSFVYGYGVDDSETIPAKLQKKMEQLGPHYEVINAGFHGYFPQHYALYLREEGFQLTPDFIIISLLPDNDLTDASQAIIEYDQAGKILKMRDLQVSYRGMRFSESIPPFLTDLPILKNSRAWYALLKSISSLSNTPASPTLPLEKQKLAFTSAVREIATACKNRGINFLFVLLPGGLTLDYGREHYAPYEFMQSTLDQEKLPFLDLGPVLFQYPSEQLKLRLKTAPDINIVYDFHLNPFANEKITNSIHERLASLLSEKNAAKKPRN